jgi:TolB protein
MGYFIMLFPGSLLTAASAQDQKTCLFQYSTDIGNPSQNDSSVYNSTDQSYILRGAGYYIWFEGY